MKTRNLPRNPPRKRSALRVDHQHHLPRAGVLVLTRVAPREVLPGALVPQQERVDLGAGPGKGVVGGGVDPHGDDPHPEEDLHPGVEAEGARALDEETGDLDVVAAGDDVEDEVAPHHDVAVDLTESRENRR
eukprot:sb/3474996/